MHNSIFTLRQLVQEAAVATTPRKRAEIIVSRLKAVMKVGVCSLYLADEEGLLTLMATDGLNPDSVGKIRLKIGEGLVGTIAETKHPLNIESAIEDPRFRYFPDSGEESFQAFLGAPVVHCRRLIGVLVVETSKRRKFSDEEESFVVTVAAHLGALSPGDFSLDPDDMESGTQSQGSRRLKGVAGAPGIGIGHLLLISDGSELMNTPESEAEEVEEELKRFRSAVRGTLAELERGQGLVASKVSGDVADLFLIYEQLLRGKDFAGGVEAKISAGKSAASALRSVVLDYAGKFEEMEDDYLKARGEDIVNLGSRVYARLHSKPRAKPVEGEKVVLAGSLVSIADIAAHPFDKLAGIVSAEGSSLSHTALLAKALGVPAVMGTGPLGNLREDELVIVDGYVGQVIFSPSPTVREEFDRMSASERSFVAELNKLKNLPAETSDGRRVRLLANTGLLADITPGLAQGAEGIGLYRSEIPFMVHESFPSEDEQVEVYRTVLESYENMPVYMRTLDIGGDKPLPYYPFKEENPALGWRGVRFTLDNSPVFMTQIRAMLRASVGLNNLHIMLPMVASLEEVEAFLDLLKHASAQLAGEGVTVARPRVGIVVEVPAAVRILRFLSGSIDFISIGSNDLSQYLLAVDRNNSRVARLFDHLHPAVLAVVEEIVVEGRQRNIPVSVCGEMAADPYAAVLLLGMGIESLSMAASSIARMKWLIRTVSHKAAQEQLELARSSAHPEETRLQLRQFLIGQGLGRLLDLGEATSS